MVLDDEKYFTYDGSNMQGNENYYKSKCPDNVRFAGKEKYQSKVMQSYIFQPDLAGCHYSKQTVAWMKENVKFVPKQFNPPKLPQARPIENFQGCLE